jgi:hypothetical protein
MHMKRTYQVGDQVWIWLGFGDVRAIATVEAVATVNVSTGLGNSYRADIEKQQLSLSLTLPRATKAIKVKIMADRVQLHCAVENRLDITREFVEGGHDGSN